MVGLSPGKWTLGAWCSKSRGRTGARPRWPRSPATGPGRLPKLFYALAPDASFTEEDFGPMLTDLHTRLAPHNVILVW